MDPVTALVQSVRREETWSRRQWRSFPRRYRMGVAGVAGSASLLAGAALPFIYGGVSAAAGAVGGALSTVSSLVWSGLAYPVDVLLGAGTSILRSVGVRWSGTGTTRAEGVFLNLVNRSLAGLGAAWTAVQQAMVRLMELADPTTLTDIAGLLRRFQALVYFALLLVGAWAAKTGIEWSDAALQWRVIRGVRYALKGFLFLVFRVTDIVLSTVIFRPLLALLRAVWRYVSRDLLFAGWYKETIRVQRAVVSWQRGQAEVVDSADLRIRLSIFRHQTTVGWKIDVGDPTLRLQFKDVAGHALFEALVQAMLANPFGPQRFIFEAPTEMESRRANLFSTSLGQRWQFKDPDAGWPTEGRAWKQWRAPLLRLRLAPDNGAGAPLKLRAIVLMQYIQERLFSPTIEPVAAQWKPIFARGWAPPLPGDRNLLVTPWGGGLGSGDEAGYRALVPLYMPNPRADRSRDDVWLLVGWQPEFYRVPPYGRLRVYVRPQPDLDLNRTMGPLVWKYYFQPLAFALGCRDLELIAADGEMQHWSGRDSKAVNTLPLARAPALFPTYLAEPGLGERFWTAVGDIKSYAKQRSLVIPLETDPEDTSS